jgi:Spy/CpxP family protein refolding chaperone
MDKVKNILAVFGLITIGFIAGFVTHRQLVKKEMQRVVRLGEAPMFREHLVRQLDLQPEQKVQVEQILDKHVQQMRQLMQDNRRSRADLIRNLEDDLKPVLSEQQLEQLQRFNRRFKRLPPPGGGPPAERRVPRGDR